MENGVGCLSRNVWWYLETSVPDLLASRAKYACEGYDFPTLRHAYDARSILRYVFLLPICNVVEKRVGPTKPYGK